MLVATCCTCCCRLMFACQAGIAPYRSSLSRPWPPAAAACCRSVITRAHCSSSAVSMQPAAQWQSLNTPWHELYLHNTLPTGQSFRWRRTTSDTYTGVIGQRVVQLKQLENDVHWRIVARGPLAPEHEDAASMRSYFNLDTSLATLSTEWSERDNRFRRIAPCIPGARMLQQDPTGDHSVGCWCSRTASISACAQQHSHTKQQPLL